MEKEFKKSPIYTKTGDKGSTSLYNGQRLPKDSVFFDVVGTLDEISSAIGLTYMELETKQKVLDVEDMYTSEYKQVYSLLTWVQSRLLDLGSHVATPINSSSDKKIEQTKFGEEHVKVLENWIDMYDSKLEKLKNFILPRGSLHMARSMCRRAERGMVTLHRDGHINDNSLVFINRLSDFLFVIARYVSYELYSHDDIIYKNN
jgi:cob(I)alamin adenosyltransferase